MKIEGLNSAGWFQSHVCRCEVSYICWDLEAVQNINTYGVYLPVVISVDACFQPLITKTKAVALCRVVLQAPCYRLETDGWKLAWDKPSCCDMDAVFDRWIGCCYLIELYCCCTHTDAHKYFCSLEIRFEALLRTHSTWVWYYQEILYWSESANTKSCAFECPRLYRLLLPVLTQINSIDGKHEFIPADPQMTTNTFQVDCSAVKALKTPCVGSRNAVDLPT